MGHCSEVFAERGCVHNDSGKGKERVEHCHLRPRHDSVLPQQHIRRFELSRSEAGLRVVIVCYKPSAFPFSGSNLALCGPTLRRTTGSKQVISCLCCSHRRFCEVVSISGFVDLLCGERQLLLNSGSGHSVRIPKCDSRGQDC
jgi:hypothetical protein